MDQTCGFAASSWLVRQVARITQQGHPLLGVALLCQAADKV